MAKKNNTKCKIYVKSISGATTADMEDYTKPSVRKSPDHFILHVGTNDLSANKSPLETANEIINLACKLQTEPHDVSVSTIILRGDLKLKMRNDVMSILTLKNCVKRRTFI